ncbi:solute carrier family 25 member 35-like [Drosophila serrata]|uniref:solute carrier family 25 member 35-like n=1 Tax=Drosophila serrata TaxID=7274 RepID=UPI000A1CFEAF|nr:solute carrier family 25 member 35-like [Drosophila serrata]
MLIMVKSDLLLGGLSAVGAVVFTNPIDVVKTRIQLQGELAARGTYVKPYRHLAQGLVQIVRNEGFLALEKGLLPAMHYQFILNAIRLSVYSNALEYGYLHNKDGHIVFYRGMFFGALGGGTGTFLGSPFYMIKAQQQAQAAEAISVGFQHKHTSMIDAMLKIYKSRGFRGFWRGATSSVTQALMGSSFQIGTFPKAKAFLQGNGWVTHPVLLSFCSGIISGSVVSLANTPFDVVTTRMYNQPVDANGRGLVYRSLVDCFLKILRKEGLHGIYKGFWPVYCRSLPHTTLTFIFFDKLVQLRNRSVKFKKAV